ncbi:MAG: MATE family efflux transporter [Bryobacterales bacterium]
MAMPSEQHPTISEPDSETEPISRNERASSAQPDSNANSTSAHRTGFWNVVWDSLKGTREDYTSGELSRAVMLLAVPMVLELVMESTFGLVDAYFVGRLGADAVAAVGLTESLIILVFGVAMGLSMGTTAMVSRRIGEGDSEGACLAAGQAVLTAILIAAPIGVVGVLLAPRLLGWMGATPGVAQGWPYTAMLFGGSATIFLLFLNNAIFRGAGDAAIAMRALWISNLINIVLDPCLIFGWGPFPELGLVGAAVATTIGRGTGVVFQFWMLARHDGRVRIGRRHLRVDWDVMRRLWRVSISGMVQFLVATANWLGIMRIVALFGAPTLAAYTIALRLIHFAILPSWGMSNAAATLVGQNLGAGKPDRAERAVWVTGRYNFIFLAGISIVFWVFAESLIASFISDPEVIPIGVEVLRILSVAQVTAAYTMVIAQAFNGAGDTDTPTIINLIVYWLWQLPLAYTLARPLGFGAPGVFAAVVIAGVTWAVTAIVLFRRGTWKRKKI